MDNQSSDSESSGVSSTVVNVESIEAGSCSKDGISTTSSLKHLQPIVSFCCQVKGGSSLGDGISTISTTQPFKSFPRDGVSTAVEPLQPIIPVCHQAEGGSSLEDGISTASLAQPLQSVAHFHNQVEGGSSPGDGISTASSVQSLQSVAPFYIQAQGGSSQGHGISTASSAQPFQPVVSFPRQTEGESSPRRKTYLKLYKAAKEGNWKVAWSILTNDPTLFCADLTHRHENILHVATQANQAHFVDHLVRNMNNAEMEMQDVNGNTAFVFAVASGNMQIVDIMEKKNLMMRIRRGCGGFTPLHVAALQGRSEMAWHLYSTVNIFRDDDLTNLLFFCVNSGIYDIAIRLLGTNPELAFARDQVSETVLHMLSRKPLGLKKTRQLELEKKLWDIVLNLNDKDMIMSAITEPSHVIFNAAEVGSFEFLVQLTSTYPYLIWEVDNRSQSIIHIAVLNRHPDIFGFMHDIGSIKDILVSYVDTSDQNNLLHLAATLAPKKRLSLVSGAAFQMTLELLWFEELKNIELPSFIEKKNAKGLTPHELFTKEHEELLQKAESWTKKTTSSCMIISALIITGVFTAAFSIPGGTEDKTGSPHYLVNEKMWFMIFSTFDAIAMISSSTSIFIFFSILISRHAEYDFQYKLIYGLFTLFISIISMMISFSSAFMMYFNNNNHTHRPHYNGLKWVLIFISVLACIPIPIFAYLLLPIWRDIAILTKFRRNISLPWKSMSW